jgi:hypothetical protein
MGDECNCEKCQSGSVIETGATVWTVVSADSQAEGRGRPTHNLYLVVTDGGISLRRQSYEM